MRIEYAMLSELHTAARRQRAQAIAHYIGLAFAWLFSHKPVSRHATRPHFAR